MNRVAAQDEVAGIYILNGKGYQSNIHATAADTRITRTCKSYTVGITSIANDAAVKNDGKYYNLDGQEVTKDYKRECCYPKWQEMLEQVGKKCLHNRYTHKMS